MAFTYSGDPASSPRDLVRFLIADVNPSVALFQDAEIDAILGTSSSANWAAVNLIDVAVARYAFTPNRSIDGLSIQWSTVVENLKALRASLVNLAESASLTGVGTGFYSGGQTVADGLLDDNDVGLKQPKFRRGQFENLDNPS